MKSINRHIKAILLLLLVAWGYNSYAQQEPLYSQYNNSLLTINPAYAGSRNMLNIMGVSRTQWVSFDGAPKTQALIVHTPFRYYSMGLGISVLQDEVGPVKQQGVFVDYAYKIRFSNDHILAFGLKGGATFFTANLEELRLNNPGDPIFAEDINQSFLPNFGVGVLFYSPKFYVGLSAPKLMRNVFNKYELVDSEHLSKEEIHFYFMAGYIFELNRIMKFKPYVTARTVYNGVASADIAGQFIFYDMFWAGLQYRIGDAIGAMVQLQLTNQLRLGYSYDFSTSDLRGFNNGTHELLLSFDFNFGPEKVRSPRYF